MKLNIWPNIFPNFLLHRETIFGPNKTPNRLTNWMCRRRLTHPIQPNVQICAFFSTNISSSSLPGWSHSPSLLGLQPQDRAWDGQDVDSILHCGSGRSRRHSHRPLPQRCHAHTRYYYLPDIIHSTFLMDQY